MSAAVNTRSDHANNVSESAHSILRRTASGTLPNFSCSSRSRIAASPSCLPSNLPYFSANFLPALFDEASMKRAANRCRSPTLVGAPVRAGRSPPGHYPVGGDQLGQVQASSAPVGGWRSAAGRSLLHSLLDSGQLTIMAKCASGSPNLWCRGLPIQAYRLH